MSVIELGALDMALKKLAVFVVETSSSSYKQEKESCIKYLSEKTTCTQRCGRVGLTPWAVKSRPLIG